MNRRFLGALTIAVVTVTAAPSTTSATLYRWTDPAGNPVVSDRPPPAGTEYQTVSTSDSMIVNSADPVNAPKPKVESPPKPGAAVADPKTTRSVYKKNPEYCQGARKNLEILARPRIRIIGEDGEARFLTEEERAEEIQKATETVEAHCE